MKKIKFQEFKIISFLFFVINSYGQIEEPQYILASKFFSSNNSIAIAVRYDNGIDSIHFPIDSNKVKVNIIKLDIEGKTIANKKVYYEYQFTPKINGTYKLPKGIIWSGRNSFKMVFKDKINLHIPESTIKLSSSDSIASIIQEEKDKIVKLEKIEKKRAENTIISRIPKVLDENIFVMVWTDSLQYNINDEVRIVVESNKSFDITDVNIQSNINYYNKLNLIKSSYKGVYENETEWHYNIFIYKAVEAGIIEVRPFKVEIEKKMIETNTLRFSIKDH